MNGNKIRKLRKEQGMTIDDLSARSGFTSSYISQIERDLIEPSLSALTKICKALNTSPYYFLEDDESNVLVARKEERERLYIPESGKELQFIVPINNENKARTRFNVYKAVIGPGKWDSQNFIVIDSDKCVIINKGKILVAVNDYNELLQDGDSIYIYSNMPHKIYNPTDEDAEIICIISPALY